MLCYMIYSVIIILLYIHIYIWNVFMISKEFLAPKVPAVFDRDLLK